MKAGVAQKRGGGGAGVGGKGRGGEGKPGVKKEKSDQIRAEKGVSGRSYERIKWGETDNELRVCK